MKLAAWLGVGAAVTLLAFGSSGVAVSASSRVVDRTFVCTPTLLYGQLRDVDVDANPLYSYENVTTPAHVEVRSGAQTTASALATVRAGSWRYLGSVYRAGVFMSSRRCAQTAAAVPLARKGIPGPPTVWAKSVECQVRGKVLVRVRAVLERSVPWRRQDAAFVGARANVVSGKVAVRAQASGAPVAYVELDPSGKTRLWFSPGCS